MSFKFLVAFSIKFIKAKQNTTSYYSALKYNLLK